MRHRIHWRGLALALALTLSVAVLGCESEEGDDATADAVSDQSTTDLGEVADGDATADSIADQTGDTDDAGDSDTTDGEDDSADDDASPEVAAEVAGKISIEESGCVTCHTDKDAMIALAPTEEVQEASGGG